MRQHYIAAQGPLPATTLDFWAMIFEQSISIVCMVTNFVESGVGKCYSYLPLSAEPGENAIKFGDYEVKFGTNSSFLNSKLKLFPSLDHLHPHHLHGDLHHQLPDSVLWKSETVRHPPPLHRLE